MVSVSASGVAAGPAPLELSCVCVSIPLPANPKCIEYAANIGGRCGSGAKGNSLRVCAPALADDSKTGASQPSKG